MAQPWLNDPVIGKVAGPVYGAPPKVEPYAAEDQQFQRDAAARAAEDQAFQREKFEWEKNKVTTDPKLVEGERTAAFLATRIAGSMKDIQAAINEEKGAEKPGVLASVAGGIFGDEARNWANSEARQRVEAAQLDILDAALTLGTGAAYTREQLEGYRRSYFPTLTDDPKTIADKKLRLQRVLEGAKVKAGKAAPQIEEALTALEQMSAPPEENTDGGGPAVEVFIEGGPNADPNATQNELAARANAETNRQIAAKQSGAGAAGVMGAVDAVTLGTGDEITAAGNAFVGALKGEGSVGDLYNQNIQVERGYRDQLQENNGGMYLGGQLLGGFALPIGIAARGPMALGKVGAAQGGAYGFGSGEGGPLARLPNALQGGAIGAGAGAALGAAGQRFNALGGPSPRAEAADAADALNIRMMPADMGGPATRLATAGTAQTMLGAGPIVRGAARAADDAAAARTDIAGKAGNILPPDEAGAAVRKGAELYTKQTSQRGSRLYDRAQKAASGVEITPSNATAAIDQNIAELQEAGELALPIINEMEKIKRSIAGGITVTGLRNARTILRGLAQTEGLRGTDAGRRFGQILEAASVDIEQGLSKAGKGSAAKMFRQADDFWRARVEQIDEVLEPIVGKGKSGEDVIRAVEQMTTGGRGGVSRLSRLLSSLPAEDAGHVRATLIDRLGRAKNDAGEMDNFSAARFITQWESMPAKAKATLFGSGEVRQGLDQLAKVAGQMKAADRYRNFSNTGGAVVNTLSAAAAGSAVASGAIVPVVVGAILNYATGRLLASPKFTRVLANIARAKASPEKAAGMLANVATREPAIRNEVIQLQQRLIESFSRPLAAEEKPAPIEPE